MKRAKGAMNLFANFIEDEKKYAMSCETLISDIHGLRKTIQTYSRTAISIHFHKLGIVVSKFKIKIIIMKNN